MVSFNMTAFMDENASILTHKLVSNMFGTLVCNPNTQRSMSMILAILVCNPNNFHEVQSSENMIFC
jgi:hypothetical protein